MTNDELCIQYLPLIKRIAKRTWIPDPDMTQDDLEQTLALTLLTCKFNYTGKNGASLGTYTHTILKNRIRDLLRKAPTYESSSEE